jgi:hypothetical protein
MLNPKYKKILITKKPEGRGSRFHRINFQLQAMVVVVFIGSFLLLAILFQITREISFKTTQLSKSAELASIIKEWETELNIGTRSRIKFISLKKPVFWANYQNSVQRMEGLYEQILKMNPDFGQLITDTLESIWQKQVGYNALAAELKSKLVDTAGLKQHVRLLQELESSIKNELNYLLNDMMTAVRKENLKSMEETISSSRKLVLFAMVSFIILNILIWLLLNRKILAPLKVLEEGANQIGEGALGYQVKVNTKNEIADLADVLNKMSIQLRKNQDAEVKLQRLETISQVVTSVNHEINNPLMIISGNAEYLTKLLGKDNEKAGKKLNAIIAECRRIFDVTQKLKDIKNPVVEKYVGEETTMIDLKRSS